jgi:hypothetical protein
VKYFFDTTPFPKAGEPLSGYSDPVSVRGRLGSEPVSTVCSVAPCPQPEFYSFLLTDANDSTYQIRIRGMNNPLVKDLTEGHVYVISGMLEHGYDYKNQVLFMLDAERVEKP